jgi:hypothetical protein
MLWKIRIKKKAMPFIGKGRKDRKRERRKRKDKRYLKRKRERGVEKIKGRKR